MCYTAASRPLLISERLPKTFNNQRLKVTAELKLSAQLTSCHNCLFKVAQCCCVLHAAFDIHGKPRIVASKTQPCNWIADKIYKLTAF